MAEQDNRRFGGDTHVGRPAASRNYSRAKRNTISEPVSSDTRSGSRGRADKLSVDSQIPSRTRKRTAPPLVPIDVPTETKRKKGETSTSRDVPGTSGLQTAEGARRGRRSVTAAAAAAASGPSVSKAQPEPSSRSSRSKSRSDKSLEPKSPARTVRASRSSAGPSSSNTVALVAATSKTKTRPTRKPLPVIAAAAVAAGSSTSKSVKTETKQPKTEEGTRRGQKRSKVEGREEGPSRTKSTKSEATTSAAAAVEEQGVGDDKGRYPLRRQVRVDQSGELIPLFPPSPTEIALAQGRKPASPRRSSATWTLSSTTSKEKTGEKSKGGESSSSGGSVPQLRVTLRRSTRATHITGSCVSSRRSSRAGKVGSVGSWAMSSGAAAGTAGTSGGAASGNPPSSASTAADAAASASSADPPAAAAAGSAPRAPAPSGPLLPAENVIRAGWVTFEDDSSSLDSSLSLSPSSLNSSLPSSPAIFDSSSSDNSLSVSNLSMTTASSGSSDLAMVREAFEMNPEGDDNNDVGRLQALLESRGLPPHLFGALGPRMQHLLNRSITVSSTSKAQQLLSGLQATGDESQQLQAVMEMCQMLIMGNEDTLTGFPVKDVVPALITLLTMDHNFVMMNHACRALTYMMEALPRSSTIVVDAVPVFLEKLQEIQCMDVAEQSLTALETLSRRHSKSILMARGVAACLKFLDFFSITAQRAALAITANCCQNIHHMELTYVADSLPILASRLTRQSDKKCVESICLSFCRLVDSFQGDPARLQEIASPQLLTNLQQLLVEAPPVISTSTFISVLRMLTTMCSACPNLAHDLLKQNMAETLCYLLTGTTNCGLQPEQVDLVSRSPQELYELTCLIGELMPRLPTDGIFSVDGLVERGSAVQGTQDSQAQWQWRDEQGRWFPFPACDSALIEVASVNHEAEVTINTRFNATTVNLNTMTQVCEDVGTTQPVRRRVNTVVSAIADSSTNSNFSNDGDMEAVSEEGALASEFVRALFSTLYEVYSSSAGPAVRYKCLKALLRMVYFSSSDLLKEVLKKEMVASHIAGMLASHDLRIVVGALQMANILMQKLPEVFGVRFLREGVTHELKQLSTTEPTVETPGTTVSPCSGTSAAVTSGSVALLQANITPPPLIPSPEVTHAQLKLSDVLSRKRKSKRGSATSSGRSSKSKQEEPSVSVTDILTVKSCSSGGSTPRSRLAGASAKTTSFLANLNPARWGRPSFTHPPDHPPRNLYKHDSVLSCSPSNSTLTAGNKEKVRTWVRDTSSKMLDVHFSRPVNTADVLSQLTGLIANMHSEDLQNGGLTALEELRDILKQSDISPFEVNHSGLVQALLQFLTDENNRDHRLRIFLHVFVNLSVDTKGALSSSMDTHALSLLVSKLNNCLSQLEQLPVKVHDLPAGTRGGTSALKFFNTHQLKCNLQRHPDCTNLKVWKGGSVKIDPLALVQAIERYLVVRGYGRVRGHDAAESDDDNSEDDDIDDTLAAVVLSQGSSRHQLQFLIGENVLPYNMTVYQAVRQFAHAHTDASETDTDNETPLGHSALWVQTHTITYRAAPTSLGPPSAPSSRKHKTAHAKSHRKPDLLWTEGTVPAVQSPLSKYLTARLPECVTISDPSLEVVALLRVVHAISRYWGSLYSVAHYEPLLPFSAFVNPKIAAKASRQLQDPLVIMTGNLPLWLQQIALACPFLLPFETRQLLFYATSFDRDRALQRLLDTTPDLTSTDSSERVTPKLDRRKRTISRNDILKQAEAVIQDLGSSRALLEVQYENEVGTGLGPTLEFYALVSRELQKADLGLWAGDVTTADDVNYAYSSAGLFPAPLGHIGKLPASGKQAHSHVNKLKTKFRFLGKLMAKAVMDSRLLDIPFSPVLFRWLLGQENSLSLTDLQHVAPEVHRTLSYLYNREQSVEGSCLDFTLPGYADIELRKGGSDINVTDENLDQYIQLVVHWRLIEGVSKQMEALKEGFEAVFPLQQLQIFYPEELDSVFCGSQQRAGWDLKTLSECFRPDHGYTMDSRAIRFLLEVLTNYSAEEQRLFLQFVTGSPRLPVGGFKSLSPQLTIVRKDVEGDASADTYLPSVMTCVNYLKLPDYSTVEVMRDRLQLACREGSHSFHLS